MNIVILAGGQGTRLWPLARKNSPKQFFPMISKKPLVKETYDRFVKRFGKNKIFFSVTKELAPSLKKIFPGLPARHFIVEPSRRDTAPAMGYVVAQLFVTAPDEPVVFVPIDHFIADQQKFLDTLGVAEGLVLTTGKLLDMGITATFPSTVLGYTKIGKLLSGKDAVKVYAFAGHTEKPDVRRAIKYVTSGNYLWHGNYYMWTPRSFFGAFKRYQPKMSVILEQIITAIKNKKDQEVGALYEQLEKISFDYAITKNISKKDVLIVKGEFGWSDIGAWDVLHEQLREPEGDAQGNVVKGNVVHIDTTNCLIYGEEKHIVAAVGLDNIVIVDTPDALLVCPKNRAQDVKKLLPEIEKRGLKKYL